MDHRELETVVPDLLILRQDDPPSLPGTAEPIFVIHGQSRSRAVNRLQRVDYVAEFPDRLGHALAEASINKELRRQLATRHGSRLRPLLRLGRSP